MFNFFKELVDSVKEGVDKVKAEAAQQQAARQQTLLAAHQESNAPLEARLAASSDLENFAVALAAVYRQTFAPELRQAHDEGRSAVHLLCTGIPPEKVASWQKLLARDFSVTNGEEAAAKVAEMEKDFPSHTDDELALWIGRASYLATGAAAVGYASDEDALAWLEPAVALAVERFSGWDNYSQSFLAGERHAPGSNILGRKLFASVTKKLLEDELSPWKTVAWPARDSLADLLDSHGTTRLS
jgi:hypothetical protein